MNAPTLTPAELAAAHLEFRRTFLAARLAANGRLTAEDRAEAKHYVHACLDPLRPKALRLVAVA